MQEACFTIIRTFYLSQRTATVIFFFYLHSTNMEDLREKTHTEHYEIFRRRRLQEMGFADTGEDNQPVRYVLHVTTDVPLCNCLWESSNC